MKKAIRSSELTDKHLYHSRRKFIKQSALAALTASILAACGIDTPEKIENTTSITPAANSYQRWSEEKDPLTEYENISGFTNFYEFTYSKTDAAQLAANFRTSPWEVEVSGLVNNPKTFDLDDIKRLFMIEERIYRMRCVEGWSMVIPWNGFPLSKLLDEVEPTSDAKFVKFTTLHDPEQMPGLMNSLPWPYIEGLRLDEAMHDLTILATGFYGEDLPPQNGAPIRLVVPWKYGLKSIKSIVRIELVEEMPVSLWMAAGPNEYGFYSNVNPEVPHPRWSQASERRIGESSRRPTELFNGYAEEVAGLYDGIDLSKWF